MKTKHSVSGFTLLEVMVASVILISAMAAISLAYRGAFVASEKAENHVKINAVVPAVLSEVRDAIRIQGKQISLLQGGGESWGVSYKWQADMLKIGRAPEYYDQVQDQFLEGPERFRLWQVSLTMSSNGIQRNYQFKEVSWDDVPR